MRAARAQAAPGDRTGGLQGQIKLRAGVRCVTRAGGQVLFVPPEGSPVRVSPLAAALKDALAEGASFDDLVRRLEAGRVPSTGVRESLPAFLDTLSRAALLDDGRSALRERALRLKVPVDALASRLARILGAVPRGIGRLALLAGVGSAAISLGILMATEPLRLRELVDRFSAGGLALFLLVVVPLHELGHAVAARLAGVPVREAGLFLSRFGVPRPYIATPDAACLPSRLDRFSIAAAGPLLDLLVCGAAAALAGAGTPLAPAARFLCLLSLLILIVNTTPLGEGDGSHMLEALLDDELARHSALSRRPSRLSRARDLAIYRAAAAGHFVLSLGLLGSLLR